MAGLKHNYTAVQISERIRHSYYNSGVWRCPSSSSGVHHWLIDDKGMEQCKYCGERRQFDKSIFTYYTRQSQTQAEPDQPLEEFLS